MERYNLAVLTKKIYESGLILFSLNSLRALLGVKRESTFYGLIKKLVDNGILQKVERNKYFLKGVKVNDFSVANFLCQPSYVSFESALSYYGILSQFPHEITSASVKKTTSKSLEGKSFAYIHLQKPLFWGYERKENFLIANPEKALLDQIYLASKGLRGINMDEYDFSIIAWKRFTDYLNKYPQTGQFKSIIKRNKSYINTYVWDYLKKKLII